VRTSFFNALIIMMNIIALASFFFMQVGSIILIIPAAVLDIFYLLNKEQKGVFKKTSKKPARDVADLALGVIVVCLLIASIAVFYGVMNSG
jgi:hypothetical protein